MKQHDLQLKLLEKFDIEIKERKNRHRLILDSPFTVKRTISYGLIVYSIKTNRSIMVCRKHSAELLLLIRGLYRSSHLPSLISCITTEETVIIEKCIVDGKFQQDIFIDIFLNQLSLDITELTYATSRFIEHFTLISSILVSLKESLTQNNLKWTWPKGRITYSLDRKTKESPFICALREFKEETEAILPKALYISNNYIGENIYTITGKNIESRYWIYIIEDEMNIPPLLEHEEVSDRKWIDLELCRYYIENISLFEQIYYFIKSIVNSF